jgi:hypothetical protein
MSFSNPLWNDMIIQQLLDIDKKLGDINTRLDNMSNRLDNIERIIFNNTVEDKTIIGVDIIEKKVEMCEENEEDDGGGWMKVNKRYNKRRF